MDDKEKRFVDELLDASLRQYASTEPRPGLEGRVAAGVRARQQAARRRMVGAGALGSAAVTAVVMLLLAYVKLLNGSSAVSAPEPAPDAERDLEIPPLTIAAIKIEPLAPSEETGEEKLEVR